MQVRLQDLMRCMARSECTAILAECCIRRPMLLPCPPLCPHHRSACRAVWYCGTTCSHADWREGGHRRVCKLLGEERQRRKAAQQQQGERQQQGR